MMQAPQNYLAVIKVVGIGGGGVNAVNRMIESGLQGVEFIADEHRRAGAADVRGRCEARHRPRDHARAWAPAPNPRSAAARRRGASRRRSRRSSRAPTWCSSPPARAAAPAPAARPIVAEIARSLGALTIGVVTRPFSFEGRKRATQADIGIARAEEGGRHADRGAERPAAPGVRRRHADGRRVPHGRPGPVSGRGRHHVADHDAGADQPGLRRREGGHDGRRLGAHGHRASAPARTAPRRPRRPRSARRCSSPRSTARRACCCRSPGPPT